MEGEDWPLVNGLRTASVSQDGVEDKQQQMPRSAAQVLEMLRRDVIQSTCMLFILRYPMQNASFILTHNEKLAQEDYSPVLHSANLSLAALCQSFYMDRQEAEFNSAPVHFRPSKEPTASDIGSHFMIPFSRPPFHQFRGHLRTPIFYISRNILSADDPKKRPYFRDFGNGHAVPKSN